MSPHHAALTMAAKAYVRCLVNVFGIDEDSALTSASEHFGFYVATWDSPEQAEVLLERAAKVIKQHAWDTLSGHNVVADIEEYLK